MSNFETSSKIDAALSQADALDASDVPRVGARELALALKILSSGRGLLLPAVTLSDEDLRRVEQDFWQI